jgi:hypothetical protein
MAAAKHQNMAAAKHQNMAAAKNQKHQTPVCPVSNKRKILDFKLSPCCECCVPSFGRYPGVLILCADVWEHSSCYETSAHKIQTPENHPKERIEQM